MASGSYRFPLRYRDGQELLVERGIDVTHEAIRPWCRKLGQAYAHQLKPRRAQPGDKWHLDEVFLTSNGKRHYLWRAVDQDDNVLAILVQSRRNKQAAKKFFRKLLKGLQYVPRGIITDKPELRRGQARDSPRSRASPESVSQEPVRELASANAPTGAAHAGGQVSRAGPAILGCVWPHGPALAPQTASAVRAGVPQRDEAAIRELGGNNGDSGPPTGRAVAITSGKYLRLPGDNIIPNNLTMPSYRLLLLRSAWCVRGIAAVMMSRAGKEGQQLDNAS